MERSLDGDFAALAVLPPNVSTFTDVALAEGDHPCYRVRAYDEDQHSSNTEPACAELRAFFGSDLTATGDFVVDCPQGKKRPRCQLTGLVLVRNQGDYPAPKTTMRIYLSDDAVWDPTDTLLKQVRVPKLIPEAEIYKSLRIKTKAPLSGKYLILQADGKQKAAERLETNNAFVIGPLN